MNAINFNMTTHVIQYVRILNICDTTAFILELEAYQQTCHTLEM